MPLKLIAVDGNSTYKVNDLEITDFTWPTLLIRYDELTISQLILDGYGSSNPHNVPERIFYLWQINNFVIFFILKI